MNLKSLEASIYPLEATKICLCNSSSNKFFVAFLCFLANI